MNGIGASPDFESIRQGILALGDVVLFLERSPVFAYDPAVFGIIEDGGLLADLQGTTITLVALTGDQASAIGATGLQLDDLHQAAARPGLVVLDESGNRLTG